MKKIMMIYGGKSGEHEVSLRSGSFIWSSLLKAGYQVIPVGISPQGIWYLQDPMDSIPQVLPLLQDDSRILSCIPGIGFQNQETIVNPDCIFPVLHGTYGEDGTLQGLMEMMHIPYVGAHVLPSALAMDKIIAKILWEQQRLPVVPYRYVESWQWHDPSYHKNTEIECWVKDLGLPLFIKPANAGSSVGVVKADKIEDVEKSVNEAMQFDTRILIEKAIDAREIELSVIGNHHVKVFPPGEIASSHTFYDYEAKYIDPKGAALEIPADLPQLKTEEAISIAEKAYRTLSLQGLSRVDLFLDKKTNEFFINEINTLPGFTSISMFPLLCKEAGLSGPWLMKELISLAFERFDEKNTLSYSLN